MKYFQLYSDVKSNNKSSLRSFLRYIALNILSNISLLKGDGKYLKKNRIQFLYIHHIFRDEEGPLTSLILELKKTHVFISYSEAISRIINDEIDGSYIVVSSDDGFKNNLSAGKIMFDLGVSCCFFINPGLVGETEFEIIRKHNLEKLHFPPVEYLNWDDVVELKKMGHEIGAHTMYHDKVSLLTQEQFLNDLESCKSDLVKYCGSVDHFAFTYGRYSHFNQDAFISTFDSGYKSCASAERGCHVNGVRKLNYKELYIRRDHIILDWKLKHIMFFLIHNAKKANFKNNLSPYSIAV